jgi:BirA family transcriptional regulator, biotin operon repressor / biotin---[acetyl-CoA-carboxylase] ligase
MAELTQAGMQRAMRDAEVPDAPARYDAVTESTNATALAWARDGAPEWTLVAAGHQTAGRGRLGRTWESRPGDALLVSVVLRPNLPPEEAVLLTLLAGAAMAKGCHDQSAFAVGCKWPNDLLLGDAKVGGILTEAAVSQGRIEHVVVGVGVNLGEAAPDVSGAGALQGVEPAPLLTSFLAELHRSYSYSERGMLPAGILRDYRPLCVTIGRRVRATTTDGREVFGVAVDLDERGALIVETDAGSVTVGFGEVHHLR